FTQSRIEGKIAVLLDGEQGEARMTRREVVFFPRAERTEGIAVRAVGRKNKNVRPRFHYFISGFAAKNVGIIYFCRGPVKLLAGRAGRSRIGRRIDSKRH